MGASSSPLGARRHLECNLGAPSSFDEVDRDGERSLSVLFAAAPPGRR
jgi:hypothetical protein